MGMTRHIIIGDDDDDDDDDDGHNNWSFSHYTFSILL